MVEQGVCRSFLKGLRGKGFITRLVKVFKNVENEVSTFREQFPLTRGCIVERLGLEGWQSSLYIGGAHLGGVFENLPHKKVIGG